MLTSNVRPYYRLSSNNNPDYISLDNTSRLNMYLSNTHRDSQCQNVTSISSQQICSLMSCSMKTSLYIHLVSVCHLGMSPKTINGTSRIPGKFSYTESLIYFNLPPAYYKHNLNAYQLKEIGSSKINTNEFLFFFSYTSWDPTRVPSLIISRAKGNAGAAPHLGIEYTELLNPVFGQDFKWFSSFSFPFSCSFTSVSPCREDKRQTFSSPEENACTFIFLSMTTPSANVF